MKERAGPNSFIVDVPKGEVPIWPLHALQVVRKARRSKPDAAVAAPVVDKKVVRAQRIKVRNLSSEEVKEAVKATARPRRGSRLLVRYAAFLKKV